jgi:REP element-mobilizing transposase RayT
MGGWGGFGHMGLPRRKRTRMQGYDYSRSGYYFLTICVKDRIKALGEIVGAASCRPGITLSDYGEIAKAWMYKIEEKYPSAKVENGVVMPNHVHMILSLRATGRHDAAPTVSSIMGYYKYQTTKEINIPNFWQRSFHDHIIRNEASFQYIWRYIDENPARWVDDCYYEE